MKKIVSVLFILIALIISPCFAEKPQHEISFNYGVLTAQDIWDIEEGLIETFISFGILRTDETYSSGAMGVTYKRFGHHFDFSVGANFQQFDKKNYVDRSFVGNTTSNWYTIICQTDLNYLRSDFFQLYSGLGAGFTFYQETGKLTYDNKTVNNSFEDHFFAFQINLLGLRIGKKIGGFLELGVGYKGIANLGVSYQF